jgi:hypothetical protein
MTWKENQSKCRACPWAPQGLSDDWMSMA